jgi:hypothetical protein
VIFGKNLDFNNFSPFFLSFYNNKRNAYFPFLVPAHVNSIFCAEGAGERRKLHNEELHDLYSSSTIVREIKSRTR